jgi:hypothetical protein
VPPHRTHKIRFSERRGFAQSAITNEARAEKGSGFDIVERAGQWEAEPGVNDGKFRITTVDRVSSETSGVAEVFSSERQ